MSFEPGLSFSCVTVGLPDARDTLAARVFDAECEAYPEASRLIAAGRVGGRRRARANRVTPLERPSFR
jgi:phosphoribosylglycinamide formyltransferase-1